MDDNQEVSKNVSASQFKAKCLALLDEVDQTGIPLTITKRGKAIATVVPLHTEQAPQFAGKCTLQTRIRHPRSSRVGVGSRPVIILDTHVWIWWVSEPHLLSRKALGASDYATKIGICPISCWEIATKVSQEKLELDRDLKVWTHQALARPRVALVAISADIAITAGQLGQQGF